jgi:hypothetical protein
MTLNKQLEQLKNNLKVPSLYYKQPEGPYNQPMNATPTFGLDPIVTPQNVTTEQPVIDSRGNVMGGDPYPNGGNPQGSMAQPGNYGTPQAPNIDGQLNDLANLMRQQATLVPPVPTQPHRLNDSQAGIPLLLAALASLDLTVRRDGSAQNFLHNTLGGFVQQNQQEAQRQDQINQQKYFVQKGTLDANTNIAKLKYDAANGDIEAARKLQGELTKIGAEGQIKKDLQAGKDQAAINMLHETIKTLPEKEQAKYMGTFNAYKAMNPSATDEQAASYAMSQHFAQIASGNLANEQVTDLQKTREARIDAISAGADVNRSRAALLDKEYENFDNTQAIKLGLLKLQIESLGLKFTGDQYKNDPNKIEYDQLTKDHAISDGAIKEYQRRVKEASDILNDVVKNATLSPEEKARLTKQRDDNIQKVKEEQSNLDSIAARMKALSGKIRTRISDTPMGGSFSPKLPLPGGQTSNNGLITTPEIRTAADALDQLGL